MSLYSTSGVVFLEKPPRSLLDVGPEASRLRLPDFDNVDQLRRFVQRLFVYDFSYMPSLAGQVKFGAVFVALLLLVVMSIIAKRMYEQSFWVIRIVKRPSGRLIVPNSMLCFAIIEGFFCAAFMALMWCFYATFYPKSLPPVIHPAWMLLPWCPLISGAVWAAWGLFFATPSHLRRDLMPHTPRVRLLRLLGHPIVTNTLGLSLPLLICASVVVPCVLAMQHWSSAYGLEKEWQRRYLDATTFDTAIVQDAQRVWFAVSGAIRYVAIGYLIWAGWAFLTFVAYTWASIRLLRTIRRETSRMNDFGPRSGIAVILPGISNAGGKKTCQINQEDVRRIRSNDTDLTAKQTHPALEPSETYKVEWRGKSPLANHASNAQALHEQRVVKEVKPSFVRRIRFVRPNFVMEAGEDDINFVGRQLRRDQIGMLNKALLHICIQACAISPACLAFFVVALCLGLLLLTSSEHSLDGGTYIEPLLAVAIAAVVWIVTVFGGITLVAIAQRTYEHMFSNIHFNAQACVTSIHEGRRMRAATLEMNHVNSFNERIATRKMSVGVDGVLFQIVRENKEVLQDEEKEDFWAGSGGWEMSRKSEPIRSDAKVSPPFQHRFTQQRSSVQDWPSARIGEGVKMEHTMLRIEDPAAEDRM